VETSERPIAVPMASQERFLAFLAAKRVGEEAGRRGMSDSSSVTIGKSGVPNFLDAIFAAVTLVVTNLILCCRNALNPNGTLAAEDGSRYVDALRSGADKDILKQLRE